jgi:hypothetical protein
MSKVSTDKELAMVNAFEAKMESIPSVITTEEEAFQVADAILSLRQLFNTVEEKRKSYTAPFNEGVRNINADFKPMTGPIKEWETKLGVALDVYADTREDEDFKKQLKLREDAGDNSLTIPLGLKALPSPSGDVRFRKGYDVTVTDIVAVPKEYLIVDTKAVEKAVKAADGNIEIPGISHRATHTHAIYLK